MAFNYGYPNFGPGYQPAYQPQPMMQPTQQPQAAQQLSMPGQQPQPSQGISPASRPVANREEANGTPADFSGSLMIFPDITHNRIYIKRWNAQTGSADFGEFVPAVVPEQNNNQMAGNMEFASLQDFQNLKELVQSIKVEVEQLKKPVQTSKGVKKNDAE